MHFIFFYFGRKFKFCLLYLASCYFFILGFAISFLVFIALLNFVFIVLGIFIILGLEYLGFMTSFWFYFYCIQFFGSILLYLGSLYFGWNFRLYDLIFDFAFIAFSFFDFIFIVLRNFFWFHFICCTWTLWHYILHLLLWFYFWFISYLYLSFVILVLACIPLLVLY